MSKIWNQMCSRCGRVTPHRGNLCLRCENGRKEIQKQRRDRAADRRHAFDRTLETMSLFLVLGALMLSCGCASFFGYTWDGPPEDNEGPIQPPDYGEVSLETTS